MESIWVFSQLLDYLCPAGPEPTIIWLILYWITFISYNTTNHITDLGGIWYSVKNVGFEVNKGSGPGSILMTVMILKVTWLSQVSVAFCFKMRMKTFWRAERKAVCSTCPLHMPWDVGNHLSHPSSLTPGHPYPHQPPPPQRVSWRGHLLLLLTLTAAGAQQSLAWISCLALNQFLLTKEVNNSDW